uniref:Protein abrupt n=1 Tax=Zeugodacus cucurbitae TaxID=28588 RepID=A0A0A1WNU1_ZEUCU
MSSITQNIIPVEKKEQISLSQKLTIHEQHHQLYALKWSEFQSSIVNCFQRLRDEEDFVDVTLSCDQRSFSAHRVVLSACSPYFRKLLKSNPCKHPIVILRDVQSDNMECLLSFMYNGEVNVRQDQLQDFLKTAHMLQIRGLTDVSDNYSSPEFNFSENKPLDNSMIINKPYRKDFDKDDSDVETSEKAAGFSKYKLFSDRPITSPLVAGYNISSFTPSFNKETKSAASCLQRENADPYRNRKNILTPPPQKRIKSADLFRAQHGINSERALSEGEFPAILQHQISRERRHLFSDCDRAVEASETNTGSSIEEKKTSKLQRTDTQSTHDESADEESNCSSEYPLDRLATHQEVNDSVDNIRPTMPNMFLGIPKSLEQKSLLNKNDFGMGISHEQTTAATLHAAKIVQLNALGHNFDSLSPLTQSHCDLTKESIKNEPFSSKICTTPRFPTEPILRQHLSSDTSLNENVKTFSKLITNEPLSGAPSVNENQPTESAHSLDEKKFKDANNIEHEEKI